MRNRPETKFRLQISKFGVHFWHMIGCFQLHHDVLCLASVNINTLLAYFDGI